MTVDQEVEAEFNKTLSRMWRDERDQKMSQGTGDFLADALSHKYGIEAGLGSSSPARKKHLCGPETPTRGTRFQPLQPLFFQDAIDGFADDDYQGRQDVPEEPKFMDLFLAQKSQPDDYEELPTSPTHCAPKIEIRVSKKRRIDCEPRRLILPYSVASQSAPKPKPIIIHESTEMAGPTSAHTSTFNMPSINKLHLTCTRGEDDLMTPVFQPRRFPDDLYTPIWTRGRGATREGRCAFCQDPPVWLRLKQSAYWYHLNYVHGISAATGRPYPEPEEYRVDGVSGGAMLVGGEECGSLVRVEGWCGQCEKWIMVGSKAEGDFVDFKSVPHTNWYKHCQKMHA